MLNYKKPFFWIIIAAVIVCAAAAVFFLTDLKEKEKESAPVENRTVKWFDYFSGDRLLSDGIREYDTDVFPDVTFRWTYEKVEAVTEKEIIPLYTGMPIWSVYFYDLTGDGKPELCSTVSLGSGWVDDRILVYDYIEKKSYELEDRWNADFRLYEEDGVLMVRKQKNGVDSGELIGCGKLFISDGKLQADIAEEAIDEDSEEVSGDVSEEETEDPQRELCEAYPDFFALDKANGIQVIVTQFAEGHYLLTMRNGTEEEIPATDMSLLIEAQYVSVNTMKEILSCMKVRSEDVKIIPWSHPASSYIPDWAMIEEGENLKQKRAQFSDRIREMLFVE